MKENLSGTLVDGILLAIGGRYNYLLHQMWVQEHVSFNCVCVCVSVGVYVNNRF